MYLTKELRNDTIKVQRKRGKQNERVQIIISYGKEII